MLFKIKFCIQYDLKIWPKKLYFLHKENDCLSIQILEVNDAPLYTIIFVFSVFNFNLFKLSHLYNALTSDIN